MPQLVTTIESVTPKATSKGEIYNIVAGGLEYSTFKVDKAKSAHSLIGQMVTLDYTEKQSADGRFTNRYYETALPAMAAAPPSPAPAWGGQSSPQPIPDNRPAAIAQDTRELRIMRQTAAKVAAAQLAYMDDQDQTPNGLVAVAEFWLDYFINGPSQSSLAVVQPFPQPEFDSIPF